MQDEQIWDFSDYEKELIRSIVVKGRNEQDKNDKFAIIDLESFYRLFTEEEVELMQRWLAMDPKDFGYKLPYLGAADTVENIVPIAHQRIITEDKQREIPCQYLPRHVFDAYSDLNQAMHDGVGKTLLVNFGYRSPARQIFIFFDILERVYDFDFNKTLSRVCFPDYSEHVCSQRQAIDFIATDGLASEQFETSEEYRWLTRNAERFGFYESYPKDNQLGMMYEPWHWHYEATNEHQRG